jgi:hypothetical protein
LSILKAKLCVRDGAALLMREFDVTLLQYAAGALNDANN